MLENVAVRNITLHQNDSLDKIAKDNAVILKILPPALIVRNKDNDIVIRNITDILLKIQILYDITANEMKYDNFTL